MHHNSGRLHLKQVNWQITKLLPLGNFTLDKITQACYNVTYETDVIIRLKSFKKKLSALIMTYSIQWCHVDFLSECFTQPNSSTS